MDSSFSQRASARRRDEMTLRRLDSLVPTLMAEHGIDCWVLTSREYADDAVVMTMLPDEWFSSRRRSILVFFHSTSGDVERFSVARYETNGFFPIAWDPATEPDQWRALGALISERDPATIAVNVSDDFAHGDGLTHSEHEALIGSLGPDLSSRVVSADPLTVNWLETRLPEERDTMSSACRAAHGLLRRALSSEVIEAGSTSTEDVTWWLRDRVSEMGSVVWFQPMVSVQRAGAGRGSFAGKPEQTVIEPGDLVHIDFGLVWDGLCTDQQQHGYVLNTGEKHVPGWMNEALEKANRLQDILTSEFAVGRTGNEVLRASLAVAGDEGLTGKIYTHPIGFQGHGAGPTIGLWDNQEHVAGSGERKLRASTAWSIELMAEVPTGWGDQELAIMLEEDAWFDGTGVDYLDGRQTAIWEIG